MEMTVETLTDRPETEGLGPRFMREEEEAAVRELFTVCHPTWPDKPPQWWLCHPTLVLAEGDRIIGSTSFSLSIAATPELSHYGDDVLYGHDLCVHPDARGRGLGLRLARARHDLGRALGVTLFLGMTWRENTAMIRIFDQLGCWRHATLPDAYPTEPSREGLVYIAGLKSRPVPVSDDGTTKGA